MNNKDSNQKKLQEIIQTNNLDKLNSLVADNAWKSFAVEDRFRLAGLLVKQAEAFLADGDQRVFEVFAKINEICPDSCALYFIQGALLGRVRKNTRCYSESIKCFEKATQLEPTDFESWLNWAQIVSDHAKELEDDELGLEADGLFFQASQCTTDEPGREAMLYWSWGMNDSFLGRLHGEGIDFKKALNKFNICAGLGANDAPFWEQYGHIVCELGNLVNAPEALIEGRTYFQKAVDADPNSPSARISLAFCDQKLYEVFGKDEDFERGCITFEKTIPFAENDAIFWCRWGILLFLHGRLVFNSQIIEASFEKFAKAFELEPDNHFVLGKWAEAETIFGMLNDRIDYLKRAEAHIISCLKLQDNNPDAWYIYGSCLNEMGRYFADTTFYNQAIEKFQYGLYLTPKNSLMAQGISLAYYSVGEMKNDPSLIELSIIYNEKAIQNTPHTAPQLYNDWGVSLMKLAEMTAEKCYLEAAIEKFEICLNEQSEENSDGFDPEWLYNYGCALDFLGDFNEDARYYEKSIQMLTKFLQIDPTYLHAYYNLASAYSHLGELVGDVDCFHKAIENYQIFLNEDSEDELVWNDYGLTLLNLADLLYDPSLPNLSQVCFSQAEEKFLQAISLGNSMAFYNLGCLYSLTGHYPQALHYMEKAEQQNALPPLDEIMDDEWLENLHQTPEFRAFLTHLASRKQDNT